LAGGVAWLSIRFYSHRTFLEKLPSPPNPVDFHEATARLLLQLDTEVRSSPRSFDRVGKLAMTYHANQRFSEASACYRLAAELSPADYRWPYYLAILNEASGDEEQAAKLLNHVTQLEPSYVHAWARLGNLLRRSSRIVEAKSAFSRAIDLDPAHPYARLGLGRIAANQGSWEKVIQTLEPTLKSHPLFAPAQRLVSRAYVQLGRKPPSEDNHATQVPIEDVIDEPLLDALYERSAMALMQGDSNRGSELLKTRCSRCHTIDRIRGVDKNRLQWLHTIGRMQGQAGREQITDSDAADILSYLVNRPRL
jgi:tetratricopeptide (TPR) repeat protein